MLSYAMLRAQVEAGRVRLVVVNNATRAPFAPDVATAREVGYPSLEVEGLIGLFGITALASDLKEKIAADIKAVSVDPAVAERLKATGQVINYGGPAEFTDAIAAQRAKISATVNQARRAADDEKRKIRNTGANRPRYADGQFAAALLGADPSVA
jgi:tripartite-type tricarboxylate transporter receptor subunit TctC